MVMKKTAIISSRFVRDAQVFIGDPNDANWDESFSDVKYPQLFVGIFHGSNDKEIRDKAAKDANIHCDAITLLDISASECGG